MEKLERVIELLLDNKKKIATMESCTGGFLASSITNIPGSSLVFEFGAVTYSNDFKVRMGVRKEVIDEYSVYSAETAKDMAYAITLFSNSDYGVGITGKLNNTDEANPGGEDDEVYFAIYDKTKEIYICEKIHVSYKTREEVKKDIIEVIASKLLEVLKQ